MKRCKLIFEIPFVVCVLKLNLLLTQFWVSREFFLVANTLGHMYLILYEIFYKDPVWVWYIWVGMCSFSTEVVADLMFTSLKTFFRSWEYRIIQGRMDPRDYLVQPSQNRNSNEVNPGCWGLYLVIDSRTPRMETT